MKKSAKETTSYLKLTHIQGTCMSLKITKINILYTFYNVHLFNPLLVNCNNTLIVNRETIQN